MRKKASPIIIIIIVAGLVSTFDEILGALISNQLPPIIYRFALPLLTTMIIVGIVLAVWEYRLQENSELPTAGQRKMIRRHLLAAVDETWITGVLEQALHGMTPISLNLLEQPDVVDGSQELPLLETNWFRRLLQPRHRETNGDYIDGEVLIIEEQPNQPVRSTKSMNHISQVYDSSEGALLILGESGSGKTTLLLELARDLLDRAERDDAYPIPLVFNLSSWGMGSKSLDHWLQGELNRKYQVPRKYCRAMINADQVIPLLDGLDEIPSAQYTVCVNAMNDYRRKHGTVPMVVCSRSTDYLAQAARISLQNAVVVQPLTPQQIDDYFASAGGVYSLTRIALSRNVALQEFVTTPLRLSMLTQVGREMTIKNLLLAINSPETLRQKVFGEYVQRVAQMGSSKANYSLPQIKRWLAWLAHQLVFHNQTEFYVEQMQPDWLPENQSRTIYQTAVRLIGGSIVGLVSGIVIGLVGGIVPGLVIGIGAGTVVALVGDQVWPGVQFTKGIFWSRRNLRRGLFKLLIVALLAGLIVGLITGLVGGLASGFIAMLGLGFLDGFSSATPYEYNRASYSKGVEYSARNSIFIGGVSGLISGLISGLGFGLIGGLMGGLALGLCGWLVGGLGFWLFSGGMACIKYIILRLLLRRAGYIPRDFTDFLDYAVKCNLLRKVGGGYIFTHALLLEYFVALHPVFSSTTNLAAGVRNENLEGLLSQNTRLDSNTISHQVRISQVSAASNVKLLLFILGAFVGIYTVWIRALVTLSGLESLLWDILILALFAIPISQLCIWFSRKSSQWFFFEAVESGTEISENLRVPLFATAQTTLEEDNRAFVGKSYRVYAGVSRDKPDDYAGEPFDLLVQDLDKSVSFDISLHASENIELITQWHQRLCYNSRNSDPHLVDFEFQMKQQGESYLVLDFYHERHWLKTIRFDFEAVEQEQRSTVLSEV